MDSGTIIGFWFLVLLFYSPTCTFGCGNKTSSFPTKELENDVFVYSILLVVPDFEVLLFAFMEAFCVYVFLI